MIQFLAAIENPLKDIVPNFGIFGVEFNALWKKLVGGVWALGVIASVVFLIMAFIAMGQATAAQNPQAHADARKKALTAGIALGCLAALAVIVGMILTVFS